MVLCNRCRVSFRSRGLYLLHISKEPCNPYQESESDEESDSCYDSDKDPPWNPDQDDHSDDEVTPQSSPVRPLEDGLDTTWLNSLDENTVTGGGEEHPTGVFLPEVDQTREGAVAVINENSIEVHTGKGGASAGEVANKEVLSSYEVDATVRAHKKMGGDSVGQKTKDLVFSLHESEALVTEVSDHTVPSKVSGEEKAEKGIFTLNTVDAASQDQDSIKEGPEVVVQKSNKKLNGERIWDKKELCIYCEKLITNFTRHLSRNHENELEVAQILALPKGSKGRKRGFALLRKKGNFYHNRKSLRNKSGSIIVVHRPSSITPVDNYLPCKYCLGFFSRKRLYRHMKHCPKRTLEDESTRNAQSVGSALLADTNNGSDELRNKVFTIMRNDSVTAAVKKDWLICEYGARMMKNHKEKHLKVHISQKLRELGRFIIEMNASFPNVKDLADFLTPSHYHDVVKCVQKLARFNEDTGTFEIPSLATKLGYLMKDCAEILECKGIVEQNSNLEKFSQNFIKVMSKTWKFDISTNASKTLEEANWNKPKLLPFADDLKLLKDFLTEQGSVLRAKLTESPNELCWRELSEITLSEVILFNRRRSGEAERIFLKTYLQRDLTRNPDVEDELTETEKILCRSFTRIEVRGKRGRRVPVLFTPTMQSSIDLLIKTRACANVDQNPYLFPIPKLKDSHLRGSNTLRRHSKLSGVKCPRSITSTTLRKHVATMSQMLNLDEMGIGDLANFMGHDLSIHKEYYRLPENTIQIAKMSKVLLGLESGKISGVKNLNVEALNINQPISDCEGEEAEGNEDLQDISDTTIPQNQGPTKSYNKRRRVSEISFDKKDPENKSAPKHENVISSSQSNLDNEADLQVRTQSIKRRKTSVKIPWSSEEKDALERYFSKNMLMKKVPNKEECLRCLEKEPILINRSWQHIKFQVKNAFSKY